MFLNVIVTTSYYNLKLFRSSVMAQYFFYKNISCYSNQFFYAFYTNFSAQSLIDSSNLAGYNILYTSLPVFVFSIMAKNVEPDKLLSHPHLFRSFSGNKLLSFKVCDFENNLFVFSNF